MTLPAPATPATPLTAEAVAPPFSLYLHIPFCQVRCAYCDFNTYAGLEALIPPYTRALVKEIRTIGAAGSHPSAHTVFFGGGTPSLLPLDELAHILAALRESFSLTSDCEITLEANPGTVSREYLAGLRDLGVNRLSFGVQSSHPRELQLLDRLHLFGDAAQAVAWARVVGLENINLDLIYGIPHQTMRMWQATLNRVLGLGPDHISAYALSLEHGTPMRAWVYRGLLPMPDPDLAAAMYYWADEVLEGNGFKQYEISNWGRSEVRCPMSGTARDIGPRTSDLPHACQHNLQYWRNLPYVGFGAGAHGCANGWRYSNVLAPAAYIERIASNSAAAEFPFSPAVTETIRLSTEDALNETMLLGLRLTREGVRAEDFRTRFGIGLEEKFGEILRRLQARQLIEWDAGGARLTKQGRMLGNIVFREFV